MLEVKVKTQLGTSRTSVNAYLLLTKHFINRYEDSVVSMENVSCFFLKVLFLGCRAHEINVFV